jgi:hypothetical protein
MGAAKTRALPLVRRWGPLATLHVLQRRLRAPVETADGSRLPSPAGIRTRPRPLRRLRTGHGGVAQGQTQARLRSAPALRKRVGRPAQPLGRGPYLTRGRGRRRVRPLQHSNAVPEMSPRGNGGFAEENFEAALSRAGPDGAPLLTRASASIFPQPQCDFLMTEGGGNSTTFQPPPNARISCTVAVYRLPWICTSARSSASAIA